MGSQKEPTSDIFCLGPQPYNRKLKAEFVLRLEFNCHKATQYEATSNAFFVFHPNSTTCEDFDLPKPGPAVSQESAVAQLIQQWPPNNFKMRFDLQVINSVRGGWRSAVKYSKPVAEISNINKARFASRSQDRRTFYIENVPGQIQNANLKQCERSNTMQRRVCWKTAVLTCKQDAVRFCDVWTKGARMRWDQFPRGLSHSSTLGVNW